MLTQKIMRRYSISSIIILIEVVIFCLCILGAGCNTSRRLQSQTARQDSTAVTTKDSTAVSSNRQEDRNSNEDIKEWVFGQLQSIDKNGQPITNVYPTAYREIIRTVAESISEQSDSVKVVGKDSTTKAAEVIAIDKSSSTKVFPMWWLFAIGAAALVVGNILGRFKVVKK